MFVFRTVLLVVHVGVVLLLFGTTLNAYLPPRWFGGANLLSLAFPFLLIFHFLLSLYWLISFRKRGIIFLLVWIFLMMPIRRWVNYSSPKEENSNLKVMSFNIKGLTNRDEKAEFLNAQNVDVLMLQESGWNIGDKIKLSKFKHQVHSEIVSIYSKYPIQKRKKISLMENGYAIFADIQISGEILRFVNVYLEPFRLDKVMVKPSLSAEINEMKVKSLLTRLMPVFRIHQAQIEEIKKHIENSPHPVVLVGDFNAVPNSYEYYQLGKNLNDAFLEAGMGSATSFHDYKFPIRIDYIFSSPSVKALSYKVDRVVQFSDHYPVSAEFLVSGN